MLTECLNPIAGNHGIWTGSHPVKEALRLQWDRRIFGPAADLDRARDGFTAADLDQAWEGFTAEEVEDFTAAEEAENVK